MTEIIWLGIGNSSQLVLNTFNANLETQFSLPTWTALAKIAVFLING